MEVLEQPRARRAGAAVAHHALTTDDVLLGRRTANGDLCRRMPSAAPVGLTAPRHAGERRSIARPTAPGRGLPGIRAPRNNTRPTKAYHCRRPLRATKPRPGNGFRREAKKWLACRSASETSPCGDCFHFCCSPPVPSIPTTLPPMAAVCTMSLATSICRSRPPRKLRTNNRRKSSSREEV